MKTMLYAAAALLAVTAVSCTKEQEKENGGEGTTAYTLELVNPLDKEIILNDDDAESFTVEINTNIEASHLSVVEKDNKDWCVAELSKDAKSIKVTPGTNFTETDLTATFVVSSDLEGVTSLEFTVIRRGTSTEYKVEIASDDLVFEPNEYMPGGYMISYNAPYTGGTLAITVKTNAASWYFGDNNMVTDDNFEPVEWYTLDKTSGRNGETVTITFSENTSGSTRTSMLYFDVEPISGMMPYTETYVSVTVNQAAAPATSLKLYDDNYDELANNSTVNLSAESTDLYYSVEANGGFDFKFVKTGTSEAAFDGENDWMFAGGSTWDPTALNLNVLANTGAERSVDLLLTPAGEDTELMRLTFVQAGK